MSWRFNNQTRHLFFHSVFFEDKLPCETMRILFHKHTSQHSLYPLFVKCKGFFQTALLPSGGMYDAREKLEQTAALPHRFYDLFTSLNPYFTHRHLTPAVIPDVFFLLLTKITTCISFHKKLQEDSVINTKCRKQKDIGSRGIHKGGGHGLS